MAAARLKVNLTTWTESQALAGGVAVPAGPAAGALATQLVDELNALLQPHLELCATKNCRERRHHRDFTSAGTVSAGLVGVVL